MPKTQTAVGIDMGAHALKVVMLRKRGTQVALARAGTIELGDLAFLDESDRKDQRLSELLRLLLRRTRIRRRNAAAGFAGRDYFVKYLHVPPTTPDKLRKLIEYEVSEDPTAASREQTTDFWLLDLPAKGEEFTVLVAMARNETLHRRLAVLKRSGVVADGITLSAIALFNAYANAMEEGIYNDKTTLLVDIGARHMDVVVQRNAKLLFVRNLTHGGSRFTEAVQEEFHLPMREAEELKVVQGAILPRHFDVAAEIDTATPEARLSAALLEPAETIFDTLQATIKYCQTQTRMPDLRIDEVVLSGRCARLRGLREFLARRFHMPVEVLDPLRGIDTTALAPADRAEAVENACSYTVAIGLALRELEERRIRPITLLPDDVRRRREFLAHDAFLYLGAAVFALAFAAMIYSSGIATAKARENLAVRASAIKRATRLHDQLEGLLGQNNGLAEQTETLKHVLDAGRRCADVLAILKEKVPPQLRIDGIQTVTKKPAAVRRYGKAVSEAEVPTTELIVEGRVAEQHEGQEIGLAAAQHIVDSFLASLLEKEHIFKHVKVTKYPTPLELKTQRTFAMTVLFESAFRGQ